VHLQIHALNESVMYSLEPLTTCQQI